MSPGVLARKVSIEEGGLSQGPPFFFDRLFFWSLAPAATPVRVLTGAPEDVSGFVAMRSLYLLGGCTQIFDGLWL
jgi:hypothetical protein